MVHDTGAAEHVAGDDPLMEAMLVNLSVALVSRQLQLTPEAAEACSEMMFMRRTGGPHPSQTLPVANHPTFEEIVIVKAAILAIIGENHSEKRKQANKLSKRGLLDQEEALGWLLCDRFNRVFPASEKAARLIAKTANDRAPSQKEKERWKLLARRSREAAKLGNASEDAVAAAAKAASEGGRLAYLQVEVALKAVPSRGEIIAPPPPAAPTPRPPSPSPPPPEPMQVKEPKPEPWLTEAGECSAYFLEHLKQSSNVGAAIIAAIHLETSSWRAKLQELAGSDSEVDSEDCISEEEEAEQVTLDYKYALKRLHRDYRLKFAGVCTDVTAVATEANSFPCRCGVGRTGIWPWQLQIGQGFCSDFDCDVKHHKRSEWTRASLGSDMVISNAAGSMSHKVKELVRKYRFKQLYGKYM